MRVANYKMPEGQGSALKGAITVRNEKDVQVGRNIAHHHSWETRKVGEDAKGNPIYDLVQIRPETTGQIELYPEANPDKLFWDTKATQPIHITEGPTEIPDC